VAAEGTKYWLHFTAFPPRIPEVRTAQPALALQAS
jgi:hypothetical protein